MSQKVAITGMGIVSSIGMTVEENLDALLSMQHGLSSLALVKSRFAHSLTVGEIKVTNEEWMRKLHLPAENNYTRTSLLGVYAAKMAVENANISDINAVKTGLISSTSVGGMDFTDQHYKQYEEHPELQKYIFSHDAGDSSAKIAQYLGLTGFVSTISTACSSAANAIMLGANMIKSGRLDRVIVGGTDALSKFTINGFNSLMILSDELNTPFDQGRKGLNLGEAAAYLVLESEEALARSQKTAIAYLSGYGNANDAYHQTASSENGEGAYLAMKKALESSSLSPQDIHYINAHGTATPNNDLSEGRAMIRVFGDQVPKFSSTKSYTGHTLAAAAAIEAVYSILSLQQQLIFPTLHFHTKMEEFDITPETQLCAQRIGHVLSNSFGFGGNCSSLIFSATS